MTYLCVSLFLNRYRSVIKGIGDAGLKPYFSENKYMKANIL